MNMRVAVPYQDLKLVLETRYLCITKAQFYRSIGKEGMAQGALVHGRILLESVL